MSASRPSRPMTVSELRGIVAGFKDGGEAKAKKPFLQDMLDSAPEKIRNDANEKADSILRGFGRAFNEGLPHTLGNLYNALNGLPEVPSAYDRRENDSVMGKVIEPAFFSRENMVSMVADPSNLIGGRVFGPLSKMAKMVRPTVTPAVVGAAAAANANDAEASLPMLIKATKLGFMPKPYYRVHPNGGVHLKPEWANDAIKSVDGASIEPVMRSIDRNSLVPEQNYFDVRKNLIKSGEVEPLAKGGRVKPKEIASVAELRAIINRHKQGSAHA